MEPTIKKGDAVFVNENISKYQLEDIITFSYNPTDKYNENVTHRIVKINKKDKNLIFHTQGDNNKTIDANPITESNIVGKVQYVIPKIGNFVLFARSIMGIITLGIIPSTIALTLYFKDFFDSVTGKVKRDKR